MKEAGPMLSELFKCGQFQVFALNKQVEDFLSGLSDYHWMKFESVSALFTQMLVTGAPAVDRIEKVSGSSQTLYELKITSPGSNGPQLRVLCGVEGRRILCVRGVDKRQRRLRPNDIKIADKAIAEHIRSKNEQRRGKEKRKRDGPP
jgi:hypothetical protein